MDIFCIFRKFIEPQIAQGQQKPEGYLDGNYMLVGASPMARGLYRSMLQNSGV